MKGVQGAKNRALYVYYNDASTLHNYNWTRYDGIVGLIIYLLQKFSDAGIQDISTSISKTV